MNARRFPPSRRRAQRGVAIVEFALIASVLIMLLIGIFEFARGIPVEQHATEFEDAD
ncbi:TadE/TadG family type IV pilus assembly protein, partial [Burkholderia cenocepacia]|uniref:TadE/TadG family type IV pilus assembly protein n=1 Tax=Burkholderia cenocepacia TaxID=95486 RepID=UPI0024B75E3E